jgi:two-component system, response regulator RegA
MIKLLLCDDDESNRLTTSALLEDEGYEVELASSFVEGQAKLMDPDASYALLIFDYELGDGFGSALATLARSRWPAARILLLTGADAVDSSNVDAVVQKGQGFEALLAAIQG